MNNTLVCMTAFNENVKLEYTLKRYLNSAVRQETDCIVLDDGSNDGTTEIIQNFASQGIGTIRHEHQRGVGAAIRTAVKYAQQKGYEILVVMSGNSKDDPREIRTLLKPIVEENIDFVEGSRYIGSKGQGRIKPLGRHEGIAQGEMPYYRKLATRIHPWLLSLMTKQKVTESTNGFRAMKVSIFDDQRINIDQSWLDHYELEPYVFYKVIKLGYKFTEVPVKKTYPSKKLGYTKMPPVMGWWSILRPLIFLGLGIKK